MNYKALAFFDLDGTLLDEHSQITPEISEAMHRLRQNDVLPIIATGRTETEVLAHLKYCHEWGIHSYRWQRSVFRHIR